MTAHVHLSLTDDHPYAQAFVVIEALQTPPAPTEAPRLAGAASNV